MLTNYFKVTLRNLVKNKSYAFINIVGLSLGIVCALLIFAIIKFDLSFDTYHDDPENIYRIVRIDNKFGNIMHDPGLAYPMPTAVRNDFPEIEYISLVDCNFNSLVISIKQADGSIEKYREEDNVAYVENDYFKIFRREWLEGNPETALENPKTVVLSKSQAQKYFGGEQAMGKIITLNNKVDLQVTGIIEDFPQNTDLPFNMLIAFDLSYKGNENWGSPSTSFQCYLKLPDHVEPNQINERFHDFISKYRNPEIAQHLSFQLQTLQDVHFDNRYGNLSHRVISKKSLLAMALIGISLLITACINFINLNTALAVRRFKEVGVRKVLGSTVSGLIIQFLGETAFITLIAVFASIAIAEVVVNKMEGLLGYNLNLEIFADPSILLFLVILFVVVTISAGFYPAIQISRFNPIESIRNKISSGYKEGLSLRKGLVVLQFAISQALILCTFVIGNQLKYLTSADMGFNKKGIVEVSLPQRNPGKLETLKNQLLQYSFIRNVSYSNTGTASGNVWGGNYTFKEDDQIKEGQAQIKFVDEDFRETYELNLLAGQDLMPKDSLVYYLVNQAFVNEIGYGNRYDEVIGKYTKIWGREGPIVGIVKDFNTSSLHEKLQPVLILAENNYNLAAIKIETSNISQALSSIKETWSSIYPESVFDYNFLDETIEKFYDDELKTAGLINTFTAIAIVIGCLGLFGLVSYMAAQRTKEIGIRKVLGATLSNILSLLSKEFAVLILIAFVVAAPTAYFFMNSWLSDFAYKIELNASIFLFALAASFLIALITVAFKSLQAASANPVESLRSE